MAGPAFFPVISSSVVSAAVWGGCTVSKVLFTKAAIPIAVLSTHYYVPDNSLYSLLQETAIPAGFDPLGILNYHVLQSAEWTRSLGWHAHE